jgi:NAD(P)-dependent dehydrogenase (short-subunit alcohol dehydrogenase family)
MPQSAPQSDLPPRTRQVGERQQGGHGERDLSLHWDGDGLGDQPGDRENADHSADPVGRLGQPEEIARAVVFLAGEEGGFITGCTLSINGGQYMM